MATITSLGFSIFSTYNGAGTSSARRDLDKLNNDLDKNNSKMKKAASSLFTLSNAAIALGPALIPLSGGLLAIGGAAVSMSASAAGAAGIFGAALMGNVKQVLTLNTGVGKLQDNLELQKTILSQLTPGTKAYNKEQVKVATAQDRYNHVLQTATPIQKTFFESTLKMKDAYQGFLQSTQAETLTIASVAIRGLTDGIKQLAPAAHAVAPLALEVANAFKHWTDNNLKGWVTWISTNGVPILANFVTIGKNLGRVFGDMLKAFAPLGQEVANKLAVWSAKLKGWADGGGFQRFLKYVKDNGPALKQFFEALGKAMIVLAQALAKMGPLSLSTVTVFLKLVASMKPDDVKNLAYAYLALKLALTGWGVTAPAVATIMKLATFLSAAGVSGSVGGIAVVLGLVAAVVIALAIDVYLLITRWHEFTTYMSSSFMDAMRKVWQLLKDVGAWIVDVFGHVWDHVKNLWSATWNEMKSLADTIWGGMKAAWNAFIQAMILVWNTVSGALKTAWSATWNFLSSTARAIWGGMQTAWNAFTGFIRSIFNAFSSALKGSWKAMWDAIRAVANAAWTALKSSWQAVTDTMRSIFNAFSAALKASWNAMWSAIRTAANAAWSALKASWQAFSDAMRGIFNAFSTALKASWNAMWTAIRAVANAAWTALKASGQAFDTAFIAATKALMSALKSAWDLGAKAIGAAWATIKKLVRDPIQAVVDVVYNRGIVNLWKLVAGAFGAKPLGTFTLPNFAGGGPIHGPGTGTSDSIVARVSNDEHIVTAAEVAGAGGHAAVAAQRAAWQHNAYTGHDRTRVMGDPRKPHFALGGGIHIPGTNINVPSPGSIVSAAFDAVTGFGASVLSSLKNLVLGGIGAVVNPLIQKAADTGKTVVRTIIPGTPMIEGLIAGSTSTATTTNAGGTNPQDVGVTNKGMIQTMADAIKSWITAHDIAPTTGGNTAGAQKWADAQVGKPYALGGNFGTTFDCSQFMSGIAQIILGHAPSPLFTTFAFTGAAQGPATFQKDLKAPFMVGVTNAGVGHMAGTLNGKNYEATPPAVRSGPGARGYNDPMFPMQYGMKASALGGVIPAGSHLAIIDAALAAAGVPPPGTKAEWEAGLNTLITRESNWNAGAINTTDSNAAAGHPSQGLAQVIPSTFAAFHVAGTSSSILDPIANVAAAIRYIVATYGNITNVQQANASLPPKGYWGGTRNAKAGWRMVDENGDEWINFHGGDKVLPHGKTPPHHDEDHDGSNCVHVEVTNQWHGNPTPAAVQAAGTDLATQVVHAVKAGVGKRNGR